MTREQLKPNEALKIMELAEFKFQIDFANTLGFTEEHFNYVLKNKEFLTKKMSGVICKMFPREARLALPKTVANTIIANKYGGQAKYLSAKEIQERLEFRNIEISMPTLTIIMKLCRETVKRDRRTSKLEKRILL